MVAQSPEPGTHVLNARAFRIELEFECLIESGTESSSSRLYYLVHYAQGEVQKLMRSCLAIDPEDGYPEACKLLKQLYGQSYKIATAYVDKVTKGPTI